MSNATYQKSSKKNRNIGDIPLPVNTDCFI